MNRSIETSAAPKPFSDYSQAVETSANSRLLHISGQVGNLVSGELPAEAEQQHEQAWRNIFAILEAAGMDKGDLIDVTAIVTEHDQVPVYRKVRDRMLEGHACASTLLVCGLASKDWKVEIAARAAKST